jgi:hypothetical protein
MKPRLILITQRRRQRIKKFAARHDYPRRTTRLARRRCRLGLTTHRRNAFVPFLNLLALTETCHALNVSNLIKKSWPLIANHFANFASP